MKKIHMIAAMLAMLLPSVVWGSFHSKHYGKMTVTASGSGTVYLSTQSSGATSGDTSYSWNCNSSSGNDSATRYCYAKPNRGYKFTGWSGYATSTDNPYALTLSATSTSSSTPTSANMTATFEQLPPVTVTFAAPNNGSYTVNGEAIGSQVVKANQTAPYSATLVATPAANFRFAGWYLLENGSKSFFSTDVATTKDFEEGATVGAEFIPDGYAIYAAVAAKGYDDLATALSEALPGESISVYSSTTLGATAAVEAGVSLTVASGVTLTVVSGATLYIDGTVANNGTISGTVSKCTKLIQQTGSNGQPFNPYSGDEKYQVTYWKTTPTTPSISVSSSATHMSIVNGYGVTVYRGATANAFVCTTDKNVAINHITGVKASYSSGTDAYNAVAKNAHNVSLATCNLMASAASELVLLTAAGTVNVGSNTDLGSGFIADCAGYNLSFTSKQFNNGANGCNVVTINGETVTSSKLTNARLTAINCTTVKGAGTDGINNNQTSYYTSLHLYDCGSFSSFNFSASAVMTVGTPGICFFSGGPYNPSFTGNYHVYGGTFSKDPKSYLASGDLEAPKEGSYWVVRTIVPTIYVAKVGATEYESLQEAVNAASANGGTVELEPAIAESDLTNPVTIAAGKTVTIDLSGYSITAPNGAIINNGTLYLQDTSTFDVPGSITTANGNMIVNNGTLDVTYGLYTGNILLNGGTFTTHFGTFDGTISVASGLDPKVVANLRGGEFLKSVSSFLRDSSYSEVYSRVAQNDPWRYWVVQYPGILTPTSYSSAEKAWKLEFMSSSDLAIYKKTKSRSDHTSLANWQRRAELYSYVQPYSQYVLDCALIFDRAVASGSVTFYGNVQISLTESIDKALAANEDYPVIAHQIYERGYTPLSYGRYIDEIGSVTAGVKNNVAGNVGTVCTMDVRVCTQSKNTVGVYDKLKTLVAVRYMLGGKKAAVDRNDVRTAYGSLADAVDAANLQNDDWILVGADSTEKITIAKAGSFTIDPYGFEYDTANVSIDDAYFTKSKTEVDSRATTAQNVESAKAVTYVVARKVAAVGTQFYDNLTEAVGAANGAAVTLLAATDETITLTAEGQSFTLNKNGVAFDDAQIVTSVEGCSVVAEATDDGTLYKVIRAVVEDANGNSYATIDEAIAQTEGNKVDVTVTASVNQEVEVPQGKTVTVTIPGNVEATVEVTPA